MMGWVGSGFEKVTHGQLYGVDFLNLYHRLSRNLGPGNRATVPYKIIIYIENIISTFEIQPHNYCRAL